MGSCPTVEEVMETPTPFRWALWDDLSCDDGCRLPNCTKKMPCCLRRKPKLSTFWSDDTDPAFRTEAQTLRSPCLMVEVGKPLEQWRLCAEYLKRPLDAPNSSCAKPLVPRILTAVGKTKDVPRAVLMIALANPTFKLEYYDDQQALA